MKIGVWISEGFNPEVGGGFSYLDRLLREMDVFAFDKDVEICYVTRLASDFHLQKPVIRLPHLGRKLTTKEKILGHLQFLREKIYAKADIRRQQAEHLRDIEVLTNEKVGIIFYPAQLCYEVNDYPFVAMNWDIGHWSTYAFPELCANGEYEERSAFYTKVLPKALMVCCESEAGKQELLRFTNIQADKIHVVPLFAGKCVDIKVSEKQQGDILAQYGLEKNRYFFYPAQFWAHKNHVNLIKAFALFATKHPEFKLILTGSDKGNLGYVKQLIADKGIMERVVFPGFVPQEHINTFYRNAAALTMVSYFGPTNMPPMEAVELGCPVIATDLAGHREQLGEAAIYIDPLEVSSIESAMEEVLTHRDKYLKTVQNQKRQTKFTIQSAMTELNAAFSKAVVLRSQWGI